MHGGSYSGHEESYSHGKSHSHESQGHHGGHGQHSSLSPFVHVLKIKAQLGLTSDQVVAINGKKLEYDKNRIMSKAKFAIARMDLNRSLHSATIDEAKIRELAAEIGNMKQEKIKANVEAKLTLLKTLTEEQRKKVNQMCLAHQWTGERGKTNGV